MATPTTGPATKKVTKSVFDLAAFDDVQLVKTVQLPGRPESVEAALAIAQNDTAKFLDIFHAGLIEQTVESAREDMTGFLIVPEDGDPTEQYTGKYADEDTGKKINAAILTLAKMQSKADFKSLKKEEKRALKDKATEFLRSNPAMLESIQS